MSIRAVETVNMEQDLQARIRGLEAELAETKAERRWLGKED